MDTKGVCLVVVLVALCVTTHATRGPSSADRSVGFQGAVSRNATGHWLVQLALVHDGHRGPRNYRNTLEWGTYDVTFRSLIRKYEPSLETMISVTVPPSVPSDYEYHDGIGYYKIHIKKISWKVANETCYGEGGQLAVINSKDEEEVVKGIVKKSGTDYVFIGLYREGDGEYHTVLGDPISSMGYVNWNGGKIDYTTGKNCVVVNSDAKLLSDKCTSERFFICEVPL